MAESDVIIEGARYGGDRRPDLLIEIEAIAYGP